MADTMLSPFSLISSTTATSSQNSAGSGTGTSVLFPANLTRGALQLKVTRAPTSSNNGTATLDVYVQAAIDTIVGSSSTYDDFIHFTQVGPGTITGSSQIIVWDGTIAPSSSLNLHAPATNSLAAGTIRQGPTGNTWRVSYVVANAPAAASSSSYVFSVVMQPYRS